MRDDDAAAFPVIEAILAALIIFGAILYFSYAQRAQVPVGTASEGESPLAAGLANLLVDSPILTPATPTPATSTTAVGGDSWLELLSKGDSNAQTKVTAFISAKMPAGDHFVLQLHNGFAPLVLLTDGGLPPAGAHADVGSALVLPSWSAAASGPVLSPGQPAPAAACYVAPNDDPVTPTGTMPDGTPWAMAFGSVSPKVPLSALYGEWKAGATCAGAVPAFVVTPGFAPASGSPRFPTLLQVVVWHA